MIDNYNDLENRGYFDSNAPTGIIILGTESGVENFNFFIKDF